MLRRPQRVPVRRWGRFCFAPDPFLTVTKHPVVLNSAKVIRSQQIEEKVATFAKQSN
jgi:hypothetical protein